jgi:hypothetical protein
VRPLPIGPELAEALRAGSEPLRQRYGALVAAEDLPLVRDVVEQTLLMPDYDDAGGWAATWRWTRPATWSSARARSRGLLQRTGR